jgi:transposase-like protein
MRKEDPGRRFSREFKIAAVQRMAAGANVSKLARELGISRKGLYQWQKQFRAGGPAALRDDVGPPEAAISSYTGDELSLAKADLHSAHSAVVYPLCVILCQFSLVNASSAVRARSRVPETMISKTSCSSVLLM